jgi:hypothetical protein
MRLLERFGGCRSGCAVLRGGGEAVVVYACGTEQEQRDLGGATAEGVAAAAAMGGQRRGGTGSECVSSGLTAAAAATATAAARVKRARARARGVRGSGRCGVGDGCQGVSGAMGDRRRATGDREQPR